jgi:CheY-like chemotaxis protein
MNKRRIMLADDESYITSVLAAKLESLGDAVDVVANGEEGFLTACEILPDLIVSDFQMPLCSGYEMAVKLRENPATSSIPVILLTARGHLLSAEELAKTNIKKVLDKPFSARELLGHIDALVGRPGDAGLKQSA